MATFFVWRVQVFAKIAELELPWPYIINVGAPAPNRPTLHRSIIEQVGTNLPDALVLFLTELVEGGPRRTALWSDTHSDSSYGSWFNGPIMEATAISAQLKPVGSMFAVEVNTIPTGRTRGLQTVRGRKAREFLVTPPLYLFADLKPDDPKDGESKFWVQPEVFEATGQIMQGRDPKEWMQTRYYKDERSFTRDVRGIAPEAMIALDSFMEAGRTDGRFGGHTHTIRPRRKRHR